MKLLQKSAQIPAPRGPLMSAKQIAGEFFGWVEGQPVTDDIRTPKWVLSKAPHKVVLGHSTVRWYRSDIEAWLASQRQESAA